MDAEYTQTRRALEAGDIFIAFTDGIGEARNAQGEPWDKSGFIAAAQAAAALSAEEIIQSIFKAADAFSGGPGQQDDMTLAVINLR